MRRGMGWTGWAGGLIVLFVIAWFVVPGFGNIFKATTKEVGSSLQDSLSPRMKQGVQDEKKLAADKEVKDNMVQVALAGQDLKAAEENSKQATASYESSRKIGQSLVAFLDDPSRDKFVCLEAKREYTRDEANKLLGDLLQETETKKAAADNANAYYLARLEKFKAAEAKLNSLKTAIHEANLKLIQAATLATQAEAAETTNIVLSDSAVGELQAEAKEALAKAQARLTVANAQKATDSVIENSGRPIAVDNRDLARKVFGDEAPAVAEAK